MRAPAAFALLLTAACSGEAEIRTDDAAHLSEDLARALRPAARAWLRESESREESSTLGHPSSAEISAQAISFQRLVQRGRTLLRPHLPAGTNGLPLPAGEHAGLRSFAADLGASPRDAIVAEIVSSGPAFASVRLTLAPDGREAVRWRLELARAEGAWRYVSLPRRE